MGARTISKSTLYKKEVDVIDSYYRKIAKEKAPEKEDEQNLEENLEDMVLTGHDRWDPDLAGSLLLNAFIAEQYGISSKIIYSKDSYDHENREMYGICELKKYMTRTAKMVHELTQSGLQEYLKSIKYVAVLDTKDPAKMISHFDLLNKPFLYIDHHEHTNNTENNGKVIRIYKDKVGANVSILLDFARQKKFELRGADLSYLRITAYRGLETDTNNFNEQNMSSLDIRAKEYLEQFMTKEDQEKIKKIKNPPISTKMHKALNRALGSYESRETIQLYVVPEVIKNDPGRVSWLARKLFDENPEKAENPVVVVYGMADTTEDDIRDIEIIASGRSCMQSIDLSLIFEDVFYLKQGEKRISFGGGRKIDEVSLAGAILPYPEYLEHSPQETQGFWDNLQMRFKRRLLRELKITLNEGEKIPIE